MAKSEKRKKGNRVLILRTCSANMRSYEGFQWPSKVGDIAVAYGADDQGKPVRR